MQLTPQYFSGQGIVAAYARDASGNPLSGFDLADVKDFQFTIETSSTKFPENRSGLRKTGLTMENSVVTGFSFTALQLNTRNLIEFFRGEEVAQSVTPVVDQVVTGTTLAVGDCFTVNAENVGSLVVEDSTGTPKVLTRDVNYEFDDDTGTGRILNLTTGGAFVGPLKASFTPGASNSVKLLTASKKEFWLTLAGINTVPGIVAPKGVLHLYKSAFEMPSAMAMINDSRLEMPVKGEVLADYLKPVSGPLGQTGRISGFGLTN